MDMTYEYEKGAAFAQEFKRLSAEIETLRNKLFIAEKTVEKMTMAIDMAFLQRGLLHSLVRKQCANITEPLVDVFEELGIEPGETLAPRETK